VRVAAIYFTNIQSDRCLDIGGNLIRFSSGYCVFSIHLTLLQKVSLLSAVTLASPPPSWGGSHAAPLSAKLVYFEPVFPSSCISSRYFQARVFRAGHCLRLYVNKAEAWLSYLSHDKQSISVLDAEAFSAAVLFTTQCNSHAFCQAYRVCTYRVCSYRVCPYRVCQAQVV
jgi:hypothetical protein